MKPRRTRARRWFTSLVLVPLLLATGVLRGSGTAQAAAGDVDLSFGPDGLVTTDFALDDEDIRGVALQADGKIVVAGETGSSPKGDFALARYLPNGTLDPTFGLGGLVTTDFSGGLDVGESIAIQADGKVVVAGSSLQTGLSGEFALARYNADGILDPSFGTGGSVLTDVGSNNDTAFAVAIQSDGKIVAAGTGGDDLYPDFAVARYTSNGILDSSWGGDGTVVTDMNDQIDEANAVLVQGDGKVVAIGFDTRIDGLTNFALARYRPGGTLDLTFSGDGKVSTDFFGSYDAAYGAVLQPDGKIVAGGAALGLGFALARYTTRGGLDASFGGDGKVTTEGLDDILGMALQPDGKIVAAGFAIGDTNFDFALARYNGDGGLDLGFGSAGVVRTDFASDRDEIHGIALALDGSIVAGGQAQLGTSDFGVARYGSDGSIDLSFGPDGEVVTNIGADAEPANGIALDSSGKIVVAGRSGSDMAVARYDSGGTLDPEWGGDGTVTTDFPALNDIDLANGVAIQGDGQVVVAGTTLNQDTLDEDFALARYKPDGTLDPSFGRNGLVRTAFNSLNDEGLALALQQDGKIIVAGVGQGRLVLARYTTNGSLDPSFGSGGKVRSRPGAGLAVKVQPDGKIVAAGATTIDSVEVFLVGRFNSDGTPDSAFGRSGIATTKFGNMFAGASGVALQGDGRIVAAGTVDRDFALARYNTDGTLDTTFGVNGRVVTDVTGIDDSAADVAVQADGKVLAVGYAYDQRYRFALVRYATDGELDSTWGGDGKVTADFGFDEQRAFGVVMDSAGRAVVAGFAANGAAQDFAVARFLTS